MFEGRLLIDPLIRLCTDCRGREAASCEWEASGRRIPIGMEMPAMSRRMDQPQGAPTVKVGGSLRASSALVRGLHQGAGPGAPPGVKRRWNVLSRFLRI